MLHEKKIEQKYLQNVNDNLQNSEKTQKNPLFLALSTDGKTIENVSERESAVIKQVSHSEWVFFDKWTRLEATLKADGRGFGSIDCFEEKYSRAYISTYRIKYKDKEYSLSPALL